MAAWYFEAEMFDVVLSTSYISAMNHMSDSPPLAPTTPHPASPSSVALALYAAVVDGDLERARAHLATDAVLHVPGDNPGAGDHAGIDAILAFVTRATSGPGATEQVEILDVLEGQQHAAVYCHVTGSSPDGPSLTNRTVHVLRVVEGHVTDIWFHNWDQRAVDEFWTAAS
jgi:uncharacterized protein